MTAISPRRGEIRPISDLPASVAAALIEVEDVDGTARQTPVGSLGGSGYPDSASSFGVPTADDEEWEGPDTLAQRGYTIESDVPAPHSREIDGTFSPSRLAVTFTETATTAYLSLYRTPTQISLAADFQVDFDVSGAFATSGGLLAGVGVRNTNLAASPGMLLCVTTAGLIELRKYSNIGTGTYAGLASVNINNPILPVRLFLHLQRVGSNWRFSWSADGVGGGFTAPIAEGAPAPAPTLIWVLIKRDNVASPAILANNWIRWNRYVLP